MTDLQMGFVVGLFIASPLLFAVMIALWDRWFRRRDAQNKDRKALDALRRFKCPKCSGIVRSVVQQADGSWQCQWCPTQNKIETLATAVKGWIAEDTAEAAACMNIIHFLRQDEGDSVELFCDNPDPQSPDHNHAMECLGWWTNWVPETFRGKTFREMLDRAGAAKRAAEEAAKHDPKKRIPAAKAPAAATSVCAVCNSTDRVLVCGPDRLPRCWRCSR